MSGLTGAEPEHLQLGDTGEGVLLLQVRLYQLGIFRELPDATYATTTENAVRELQSTLGQDNDGEVHPETWDAIVELEQRYSIQYQYMSPYDALSQIRYDRENPSSASGDFPVADGQLSEDGQWRWDGYEWQPASVATSDGQQQTGQLSPDGQWQWNGYEWQAATGPSGNGPSGTGGDSAIGQLSEDGQWQWNGYEWQAATATGGDGYVGQLSEDGQWRWDGSQWQAA